ncbi:MAG: DUF4384 domain-containing protein [Treponema sp.]|nr:DUF4384 domain-containing protein [Treponema sp.]
MKKIILILLIFTFTFCKQTQELTWEVKFQKGQTQESVPINQIIQMVNGETFLFAVHPDKDAYCYIICYDSSREIMVLHDQLIPGGQEKIFGAFQIEDPPGTETIYLIMSLERQNNLESLIQNFHNNLESRQASNNLYREILSLQNSVSRLGEPASSYVPGAGTARGASQQHVTRFSGSNLYVRAITIRH